MDPWGTVICQCAEGKNIAVAEIRPNYIQEVRTTLPVWKHRRADIYPDLTPKRSPDEITEHLFHDKIVEKEAVICKTEETIAFLSSTPIVPVRILTSAIYFLSNMILSALLT